MTQRCQDDNGCSFAALAIAIWESTLHLNVGGARMVGAHQMAGSEEARIPGAAGDEAAPIKAAAPVELQGHRVVSVCCPNM